MFDDHSAFEDHVFSPRGAGAIPPGAIVGAAGGSACGDMVTIGLVLEDGTITSAGFTAEGCSALTACASVVIELVRGGDLLFAAGISREQISDELGGLSAEREHAAILAEEALHRALGMFLGGDRTPLIEAAENRVLIALSGGVDSAVAAQLMVDQGREAAALTLQLWDDPATDGTASCCSPQAVTQARRLAHSLGIPHFTVDLRDAFRKGVVDPYLAAFGEGLTPNPCVGCNGHVRFDALDDMREQLGARTLATGHYARIVSDENGPLLEAAVDDNKDQTYMLAAVEPRLLGMLEFPLGELTKPQVRDIARAQGMAVAEKPESQDLCFLAGIGRDGFLAKHSGRGDNPGPIVDIEGNELGTHSGSHRFTVGQRRGLGVAAPEPLYVLDVDSEQNLVVAGFAAELETTRVCLIGARLLRDASTVDRVKLRYRNPPASCSVVEHAPAGRHRNLTIKLAEPVLGAAPGQIACLMRGDTVVGWATIARSASSRGARIPADEFQRDPRDIPVVL